MQRDVNFTFSREWYSGQLRITIWITLVGLELSMIHTKFRDSLSLGFGQDNIWFLKGPLRYTSLASILPNELEPVWTNLNCPELREQNMKYGYNRSTGFEGEVVWNCCQRMDNEGRRTTYLVHPIRFPGAFDSGIILKIIKRKALTTV